MKQYRRTPTTVAAALVSMLLLCTPSVFGQGILEERALETVSSAAPSRAAEVFQAQGSPAGDDAWQFLFAPYGWGPNVSGDLTLGPIHTDVDLPLTTSLKQLQGAFFGRFEARKSHVGLATDLTYLSIGKGGAFSVPVPGGGAIAGDLAEKVTFWELWPYYRFGDGNNVVDVFGGIRYNAFNTEVAINQLSKSTSKTLNWTDPMFGVRWLGHLSPKIALAARGDLAGFGAGSNLTANIQGDFLWQFHSIVGLALGYRWMNIDYEKEALGDPAFFKLDASLHGPLFGLTFAW